MPWMGGRQKVSRPTPGGWNRTSQPLPLRAPSSRRAPWRSSSPMVSPMAVSATNRRPTPKPSPPSKLGGSHGPLNHLEPMGMCYSEPEGSNGSLVPSSVFPSERETGGAGHSLRGSREVPGARPWLVWEPLGWNPQGFV